MNLVSINLFEPIIYSIFFKEDRSFRAFRCYRQEIAIIKTIEMEIIDVQRKTLKALVIQSRRDKIWWAGF